MMVVAAVRAQVHAKADLFVGQPEAKPVSLTSIKDSCLSVDYRVAMTRIKTKVDPELSREAKESKAKLRSEKAGELQNMDREIREFQQSREKQLQEQSVRMRAGIVDDINKVVQDKVKADNFTLVFDKSGPSLNGVPIVLYSQTSMDFSEDIIAQLNKNKPKETTSPAPAASPAAKPEKKP